MTYYFLLPDLSAGGAERVSITMARLLRREGRDVRFLCLGSGDGEMRSWIVPEFQLEALGCKRVLSAIPSLCKFLHGHKDVVLFSSREHVSIAALIAGKLAKVPVIVRMPNMPSNRLHKGLGALKWNVIRFVNRRLIPNARTIISQTDTMREEVKAFYRLPDNKVVTIYNPVDKEHVCSEAEQKANPFDTHKPQFLCVGNIAHSKGIDILLQAFAKVHQMMPDACLSIIGRHNTEYANQLRQSVKDDTSIRFLGFIQNPYPYMKHCDVFILPSRMEGFPNVLLEAMCFNKPVAATTCVPIIEKLIQEGENGYYCPTENVEALAECMMKATQLHNISNQYELFQKDRLLQTFPL